MSDHDAAQGPIDKAYVQAEALLDDEAARAARRARVLGAVESEARRATVVSAPRRRHAFGAASGWLVAASVAGISALVALQFTSPPVRQRPPSPAQAPVVAAAPVQAPGPAPDATPPATPPSMPAVDAPPPPPAAVQPLAIPPADIAAAAPSAFPAPPSQAAVPPVAAPPPPSVAHRAEDSVEALIVTGQAAPSSAARMEAPTAQGVAPAPPEVRAARLRAAAAAGRVSELTALLAQGTPVDAPDSEGETALMKAIQARNPDAAALLRRHGASLDRTNRAGVSARAMAAAIDDPALNQALGLEP